MGEQVLMAVARDRELPIDGIMTELVDVGVRLVRRPFSIAVDIDTRERWRPET